jgi:hypothetical protein
MVSDSRAAVAITVIVMDLGNPPSQGVVGFSPWALRPLEPAVKTAARESQDLTELRHRILRGKVFHLGKSSCSGFSERMPKAFFRISFLRLAV